MNDENNNLELYSLVRSTGNWHMLKPAVPFETIMASDWNNEFQNVIDNCNPDGVGTASENLTNMQKVVDPYPSDNPYFAVSLRQELEELRFQLKEVIGKTYWYERPEKSIEELESEIIVIEQDSVTGGDLHDHTGTGDDGGGALIGTDAIEDEAVTKEKLAPDIFSNNIVSYNVKEYSAVFSFSNKIIPLDQTIPQNDEGIEYVTYTYSPKVIGNTLDIAFDFGGKSLGDASVICAIFINDETDARSASSNIILNNNAFFFHSKTSFSITSLDDIVIKIRLGVDRSAGSVDVNYYFGSSSNTTLTVKEIEAGT